MLPSLVRVRQPQTDVHLVSLKKNSCAVLGCVLTGGASRRSTPRLWLPAPRSLLPPTQPIFGTARENKQTQITTRGSPYTGHPIEKERKTSPSPKVQRNGSCAPSVHAEGVAQRVLNTFNAGQVACELAKVLQSVKHHASCEQRRIPIQVSGPVDSIDNRGHNTKVIVGHTTGHTQEGLFAKLLAETHLVAEVQRERTANIMLNGILSSTTAAH